MSNQRTKRHEVVIIGGGISGATAAFYLGSYGYDVAILEKTREPHHKVCGEFLSGETLPYLEEMNLDLSRLGARTVSRFKLHSGAKSTEVELPFYGRGFSRYQLDMLLLKQAEAVGVTIYRGTNVRDVSKYKTSYSIRSRSGDFESKSVFLATGKHAFKKLHVREGKGQDFLGFKFHLKLPQDIYQTVKHSVELFTYPGGYGGIAPIEDDMINLCFLLEQRRYKELRARGQNPFDYIMINNKRLSLILERATIVNGPFAISNIPYGFIYKGYRENTDTFILGDQSAVIPSLAGDGMAIAFYTGRKAAMYYHEHGAAGIQRYHEEISSRLKRNIFLGFAVQQTMRFSLPLNLGISVSNLFPKVINWIFAGTRTPSCRMSDGV